MKQEAMIWALEERIKDLVFKRHRLASEVTRTPLRQADKIVALDRQISQAQADLAKLKEG